MSKIVYIITAVSELIKKKENIQLGDCCIIYLKSRTIDKCCCSCIDDSDFEYFYCLSCCPPMSRTSPVSSCFDLLLPLILVRTILHQKSLFINIAAFFVTSIFNIYSNSILFLLIDIQLMLKGSLCGSIINFYIQSLVSWVSEMDCRQ